jgi:hypothetical protein
MKALALISLFVYLTSLLSAQGPASWNQSTAYTHPSLVINETTTYLSLKNVASGIEITNTEFWKPLDELVPKETPTGQDDLPDVSTFADDAGSIGSTRF